MLNLLFLLSLVKIGLGAGVKDFPGPTKYEVLSSLPVTQGTQMSQYLGSTIDPNTTKASFFFIISNNVVEMNEAFDMLTPIYSLPFSTCDPDFFYISYLEGKRSLNLLCVNGTSSQQETVGVFSLVEQRFLWTHIFSLSTSNGYRWFPEPRLLFASLGISFCSYLIGDDGIANQQFCLATGADEWLPGTYYSDLGYWVIFRPLRIPYDPYIPQDSIQFLNPYSGIYDLAISFSPMVAEASVIASSKEDKALYLYVILADNSCALAKYINSTIIWNCILPACASSSILSPVSATLDPVRRNLFLFMAVQDTRLDITSTFWVWVNTDSGALSDLYNIQQNLLNSPYTLDSEGILYGISPLNQGNGGTAYGIELYSGKIFFNQEYDLPPFPAPRLLEVDLLGPEALLVLNDNEYLLISPAPSSPFDWKAFMAWTFTALNFLFTLRYFCVNGFIDKVTEDYVSFEGTEKAKFGVMRIRNLISLSTLVVLTSLNAAALKAITQQEQERFNGLFKDSLSFYQSYITPCYDGSSSQYGTLKEADICFCSPDESPFFPNSPQCSPSERHVFSFPCNTVVKNLCACQLAFFEQSCSCASGGGQTNLTSLPSIRPQAASLLSACENHYKIMLYWTSLEFWFQISLAIIVFFFQGFMWYCQEKEKDLEIFKAFFSCVSALIHLSAFIISVTLISLISTHNQQENPCASGYLSQIPGCMLQNSFVKQEMALQAQFSRVILLFWAKPIYSIIEAIGKAFARCSC